MSKRGYSRDFTPRSDTHGRYLLDKIPATLWADVRAKAKRDGVSLRGLILSLLKGLDAPTGRGETQMKDWPCNRCGKRIIITSSTTASMGGAVNHRGHVPSVGRRGPREGAVERNPR